MPHPRTHTRGDLWSSGKHANHDGNIQVITVPDGWPTWTSDVRPGREHDTIAILPASPPRTVTCAPSATWDYEGEADTITVAFKTPPSAAGSPSRNSSSTTPTTACEPSPERGNALRKLTPRALRNVSLCPGSSGRSSPQRSFAPLRTRPHNLNRQLKPLLGMAQHASVGFCVSQSDPSPMSTRSTVVNAAAGGQHGRFA
ncbi:hypothetical protein GCM10010199_02840 [Dactylosporangium roseum]